MDKGLTDWDGLKAAIFVLASRDDIVYIQQRARVELRNIGINSKVINAMLREYSNYIKDEVGKYVINEYEVYPNTNVRDTISNKARIKNYVVREILKTLELKKLNKF